MKKIDIWIATGFGLGYSPIISGTVGTLGGIILFWIFHRLPWPLYLATLIAFSFLGIWSADRAERVFQKKDSGYIVIDEIVGFLVAVFLIPWKWPLVVMAFFLFRVMDILKPFPLRSAEKLPGGLGVMLDDIGAGIYTNVLLQIVKIWL